MIAITGLLQQVHQLCPGESQHCHLLLFQQGFLLQGCFNKFTNYVQENLNIVIGTVVGVAAVQLLAIIFAFCVCKVSR